MAVPKQAEISKKEKDKLSLRKSIGGEKLSEKKMCSILRSSVRKSWMQSPVRLLKLEEARMADMDDTTRTKWLCECENCHGLFKMSDVEVDHIKGEHKLSSLSDVEHFARSILDVTLDDLQVICKPCHEIKTYAERYGITFEQAKIEKRVILWQKTHKPDQQKIILKDLGFSDDEISNGEKRKDAYRKFLMR